MTVDASMEPAATEPALEAAGDAVSELDESLPNLDEGAFARPTAARLAGVGSSTHPPRFLMLYGSLLMPQARVGAVSPLLQGFWLTVHVSLTLAGYAALAVGARDERRKGGLDRGEMMTVAFFGVRGVGSLYYLAYAASHETVPEEPWLWSTVAFSVIVSVLLHGVTATPVMARLDARRSG